MLKKITSKKKNHLQKTSENNKDNPNFNPYSVALASLTDTSVRKNILLIILHMLMNS